MPVASSPHSTTFFVTGGTLPPDASSYVERQADRDLFSALVSGEYCYVLNSRQMGKSSLSVRTIRRLQEDGVKTAFIDLTRIGAQNVTAEQWYAGLLAETGRALSLRAEFLRHWKEHIELPPVQRYFTALREVALPAIEGSIVLFVDEIDAVRSLSFSADEFFAAVRACLNARTEEPIYRRLTFCLVGSARPSDLISDTRMSPFNVGRRIELRDFTREECAPLSAGLDRRELLDRVYHWTNGHPYLTQSLCQALTELPASEDRTSGTVDQLVTGLFFEAKARERNPNLADVSNRLLSSYLDPERKDAHRADILDLYGKVLRKQGAVDDDETNPLVALLKLAGITRVDNGKLSVRNRIYERVFDRQWILEGMPDQEVRRQRRAFWVGVGRTGTLAGVILASIGALAWNNMRLRAEAERARDRAEYELYAARTNLMAEAWARHNVDLLTDELRETEKSPHRDWEWGYWHRLAHRALFATPEGDPVLGWPVFSADGATFIVRHLDRIVIYDSRTFRPLHTITNVPRGAAATVQTAAGTLLDRSLLLRTPTVEIDPATGRRIREFATQDHLWNVPMVGHKRHILLTIPHPQIPDLPAYIRDLKDGGPAREIRPDRGWEIYHAALTSNEDRAVFLEQKRDEAGKYRSKICVYALRDSTCLSQFSIQRFGPLSCRPGWNQVAVNGGDGHFDLYDLATGKPVLSKAVYGPGEGYVSSFSADGRRVSISGDLNVTKVFDLPAFREVATFGAACSGMLSPDGSRIVTNYFQARVYALDSPLRDIVSLPGLRFSRLAVSTSGALYAMDTGSAQWIIPSAGPPRKTTMRGTLSEDGRLLVEFRGGRIRLTDTLSGRSTDLGPLNTPDRFVRAMPGPFATAIYDYQKRRLQVYENSTGRLLWKRPGVDIYPSSGKNMAFSRDGAQFAFGDSTGQVTLYNTRTGRGRTWEAHAGDVSSTRFSPDGRQLLTTGTDDMARVFDLRTGGTILLKGHSQSVLCGDFSPDGRRIVTCSADRTLRIWDAQTGRGLTTLEGHTDDVTMVLFHPNGKDIVSCGMDGKVITWRGE